MVKLIIKECPSCKSKELYEVEEDVVCMNCNKIHFIQSDDVDRMSMWLWRKAYNKSKK